MDHGGLNGNQGYGMRDGFHIRAGRGDICCGPDLVKLYGFEKRSDGVYGVGTLELKKVKRHQALEPFVTMVNEEAKP